MLKKGLTAKDQVQLAKLRGMEMSEGDIAKTLGVDPKVLKNFSPEAVREAKERKNASRRNELADLNRAAREPARPILRPRAAEATGGGAE